MQRLLPPTGSALRIARLTVLLAAVFLSGCGVTSFYVPVQRPMEINLTRMQRIGVAVAIVNRDSVNVQFSEEAHFTHQRVILEGFLFALATGVDRLPAGSNLSSNPLAGS